MYSTGSRLSSIDKNQWIILFLGLVILLLAHAIALSYPIQPAVALWFLPSGIAITLILWLGLVALIPTAIAGVLMTFLSGYDSPTSLSTLTDVVEPLIVWLLYYRYLKGSLFFENLEDALKFIFYGVLIPCGTSAVLKSLILLIVGNITPPSLPQNITDQWLSHAIGTLAITPTLILVFTPFLQRRGWLSRKNQLNSDWLFDEQGVNHWFGKEFVIIVTTICFIHLITVIQSQRYFLELSLLNFIFIIWGAIKFGKKGGMIIATLSLFLTILSANILGFESVISRETLQIYRLILLGQGGIALLLGTAITEKINSKKDLVKEKTRRQELEALIENSPDIVTRFDRNLRYVYISPVHEKVTGLKSQELIGKTLAEVWKNQPLMKQWQEKLQKTLQTGQIQTDEFSFLAADGITRYYQARIVPEQNKEGSVMSILVVSHEITTLKNIEKKLQEKQHLIQNIADTVPAIVYVYDLSQYRSVYINQRISEILGYTPETIEAIGRNFLAQLIYPEDLARLPKLFEQIRSLQDGEVLEFEYRIQHSNGKWVSLSDRLTVFTRNPQGLPLQILGVAQDITLEKHREANRQSAEKALRESEERLRLALKAANQGLYDLNLQTGQAVVSPEYAIMLGYDPEEFTETNQAWRDRLHPEDQQSVYQAYQDYIAGDRDEYCVEFRQRTKSGQWKWILSLGKIVDWDRAGNPLRMLGTHTDITTRKQAEKALSESQERLNIALEAAKMGSWDWNIQTGEVYWSSNLEKLFGLEPGTFNGRYETVLEMIHPDDRQWVVESINRAVYEKEDYNIEFRFIKPDGAIRWAVGRGKVFYDSMGNPLQMTGVDLDISDAKRREAERKQTEEALFRSELMFRTLADTMPQMFWVTNPDGYHEYFNQRWYDYTGTTLEQAKGEGWQQVLHPDDVERTLFHWQDSLETGKVYEIEYRFRRASDGEYRWHLGRAFPLAQNGKIVKWFGSCTDIHEQKLAIETRAKALEQERAARLELERANRMKDEFLAIVSHELRSPLNGILGWSRLLRMGKLDPEKTAQGLASIERNAQAQTQLIEDLLDISRIIRGKVRLILGSINLKPIIQAALDTIRPTATTKSIELDIFFGEEVGLVQGDPERLQQIVWNLLSNAVKFTPEGGRIEVRLQRINHHAQIQVIDTGIGIKPEFLPYVFDRFRQADATTTRTQSGLGLGLAIVRNLVELHGGTIQADSKGEGQGATFTVEFPLLPVPNQPTKDENASMGSYPMEPDCLKGLRVLVVDDETDTLDFLVTVLEQFGAVAYGANSAQSAYLLLQQKHPDLLLSDIGMPSEDGYTLIRKIRALPPEKGGQIAAAALTAYVRSEDRAQALAAGYQMHLPKPIEPMQLLKVVAQLAGRLTH